MKQIKLLALRAFTCISFLVPIKNELHAQNYFAGTGAGTGNTGINITGVGTAVISSSNTGSNLSAFGFRSLFKNTTGGYNTAIGAWSLYSNLNGNYNAALGYTSLYNNTSGTNNTATGMEALYSNKGGSYNSAVGYDALFANISGNYNTASGYNALRSNNLGDFNAAFGAGSLSSLTSGIRNTAMGFNSMKATAGAYDNTAIGAATMTLNAGGEYNVAVGSSSMELSTSGNSSVGVGYQTLQHNSGSYNTALGSESLVFNTNGQYNAAVGYNALLFNSSGNYNSASGTYALTKNSSGNSNTASGYAALRYNKNGDYNIAFGDNAGASYAFSNSCSFLGTNADALRDSLTNATAIGYQATVDNSNKVVVGNMAVTSIGGQVGWTTYSDQRLKTNINKSKLGLDFILSLNPVTYNYKAAGQKDILYTGLIAQEVDAAANKANVKFSGVDKNGSYWGIRYAELTVPLIKAMQEMNEKETAKEIVLGQRIEKLEAIISQLQNSTVSKTPAQSQAETQTLLFQNQPNPFDQSTTISYQLAKEDEKAAIVIRNINGTLLKEIVLTRAGKGSTVINANEFSAGTYTYTLVVNGKSRETKLMILIR